jgi:pimeloyl-ACP methyl ester carboxylesterase
MSEQIASANGIEIAYEEIGDPADPPMLLIMGLGMQLIHWDRELCELLAGRGFRVIRFDNRDAGHSTKIEDGPKPNVWAAFLGRTKSASYTLDDMAADAFGLLDHLGIERAHLVGASQGGAIAQTMAIRRPDRVLSLASLMSSTGKRRLATPRLRAMGVLLSRPPREREAYIEHSVRLWKRLDTPEYPMDEQRLRERVAAAYDRSFYPRGVPRQLLALLASGDRTRQLCKLRIPTVVIHGDMDPLVPYRAGKATAAAIPDAELVTIEGMGHVLPPEAWPRILDAVARNAAREGSPIAAA